MNDARFGIALWDIPLDAYTPVIREAEEIGFEQVWLADHLVTPVAGPDASPYSGGKSVFPVDSPLPDVWVTLAHAAALTTRIQLATGVFVLPLREPFATAKAISTLQHLSGNRVMVGIGVGWRKEEFEAVGAAFAGRGRRAEEMLAVMTALWTGQPVSANGATYRFEEVVMAPATQKPPIIFGGVSEAAISRAARLGDGWLSPSTWSLEQSAETVRALDAERAAVGREGASFDHFVRLNEPSSANLEAGMRLGHRNFVIPVTPGASEDDLRRRVNEIAVAIGLAG